MQSDESMAQECRHSASDIPTQTVERTASLAVSSCSVRRNSVSHGESQQLLVLLVWKENKGA